MRIIAASLIFVIFLAGCGQAWNDPYPASDAGRNILYTAFTDRPKHLDPAQSYTEDSTPGCTTEAQQFRDLHAQFVAVDTVLLGISRDSVKSHENFKSKQDLPFELGSDSDEALCTLFGVMKMKNMYGKQVRGIERSTFVIDKSGVLRREWRGVKVPGHAQEVLDFVKTL